MAWRATAIRAKEEEEETEKEKEEEGRSGWVGVWRVNTKRPAVATAPHYVAIRVDKL
jgi:hypothetical protein